MDLTAVRVFSPGLWGPQDKLNTWLAASVNEKGVVSVEARAQETETLPDEVSLVFLLEFGDVHLPLLTTSLKIEKCSEIDFTRIKMEVTEEESVIGVIFDVESKAAKGDTLGTPLAHPDGFSFKRRVKLAMPEGDVAATQCFQEAPTTVLKCQAFYLEPQNALSRLRKPFNA